jgi:hypothetical protein
MFKGEEKDVRLFHFRLRTHILFSELQFEYDHGPINLSRATNFEFHYLFDDLRSHLMVSKFIRFDKGYLRVIPYDDFKTSCAT